MYKLGDYNAICDLCGVKYKASELRKQWDNLRACPGCWSPRNPQDFVKSVPDDQSVPWARPDIVQAVGTTTVQTSAARFDLSIDLVSVSGLSDGSPVGITLDDGTVFWTYCDGAPAGNTITSGIPLWGPAAAGNTVYKPDVNNETFVTASQVLASEL